MRFDSPGHPSPPCLFLDTWKAAVESAEAAVREAQEEAIKVLGEEEESDDDDDSTRHRPPPPPAVSEAELYEPESVARKARKAGGTMDQVMGTRRWPSNGMIMIRGSGGGMSAIGPGRRDDEAGGGTPEAPFCPGGAFLTHRLGSRGPFPGRELEGGLCGLTGVSTRRL